MAKDTKKDNKEKIPRARTMWFCTNCYAVNGDEILTFEKAKDICLMHGDKIERYGIGLHDKDEHDEESISERDSHRKRTYMEIYKKLAKSRGVKESEADESGYVYDAYCEQEAHKWSYFYYPVKAVGDHKEMHVHVVLQFKTNRALNEIAKWFGIPMNMIDIVPGHGGFERCAQYLVHKKQPEKFQYNPNDIFANFNYIEWLDNQAAKDILHEKYHMHIDDINDIVNKVANEGLSLREVEEMVSSPVFLRNRKLFRDARDSYIYNHMDMPPIRHTFYVDAPVNTNSGMGKSIATKALCKQFAREYGADITKDLGQLKDYIYKAGGKGVAFQRYDGQPIIYIDDREAIDMLMEFGGHDGVKNLLERFPEKESTNIKFGDTVIVAKYIVINGIQHFTDFVNGLNGSYTTKDGVAVASDKDLGQYTRRITGIVQIMENDIVEFLFNKGILKGTREFEQYESIKIQTMNYQRLVEKLSGDARAQIETKSFDKLVEETKAVEERLNDKITEVDKIPDEFKNYGEAISPSDLFQEQLDKYIDEHAEEQIQEMFDLRDYTKFCELWIAVNAEDLVSHKKKLSNMATFEDWKKYGRDNRWDEKRGFYREEVS